MRKLDRYRHRDKDAAGRYQQTPLCDACNRPVGTNYFTDGEVCGDSDGPGFFICERKSCEKIRAPLSVEQRRRLYERNREVRS